jgi:hypothetical protein
VSRTLREEERQAWQRLIRVLGHELNNSLAPIRSISGSLEALVAREPRPADWDEDMRRGLAIITARSEALSRFMEAYARLARLPPPQLGAVAIGPLVRRVAGLETRLKVAVRPGPERPCAPTATLEQLSSASCATPPTPAWVGRRRHVGWDTPTAGGCSGLGGRRGAGACNTSNLFVPFFTTKPEDRDRARAPPADRRAHGGIPRSKTAAGAGCRAHLRLPM